MTILLQSKTNFRPRKSLSMHIWYNFFFHLLFFFNQFIALKDISKHSQPKRRENALGVCTNFYLDNTIMVKMVEETKISI